MALARAAAIGMPLKKYVDAGLIELRQLDPGELAPGQFVNMITTAVDREKVKVILIDSLNGYLQAMPAVKFLNIQFHELLTLSEPSRRRDPHDGRSTRHLRTGHDNAGRSHLLVGLGRASPLVSSRRVRSKKAISVLKKRIGRHEATIRQIQTDSKGLQVGEILRDFQGVLTGTPSYRGDSESMLRKR